MALYAFDVAESASLQLLVYEDRLPVGLITHLVSSK